MVLIYNFKEKFPNYDVSEAGVVYKNGAELKPFKSNKYLQVLLYDTNHNRHVLGVHTVVAMKYLNGYRDGCVVHHIDGDCHNNKVDNLQVLTRNGHSKMHLKNPYMLADYIKKFGPANKGKKMSTEFCEKCSESAKKRGFNGNQFIDKFGNKR